MTDALYTRVSTLGQHHDPQLRELRQWCKERKIKPAEFLDTMSGSKWTRNGLDALLDAVRSRKVKRVIVSKLDRIGRSISHFLKIIAELREHGCAFVCTTQGIDTGSENPGSKFYLHILACVAEFERDLISERTKAGIAVARANGKQIGRAPTVQIHTAEVRKLLKRGLTMEQVAHKLKIGRGSVWRMAHKK